MGYVESVESLNIPIKKFMIETVIPILVFGVVLTVVGVVVLPILLPELFSGFVVYIFYLFPVLCLMIVLLYPAMIVQKRKREIDENMHFFITRIGVLSLSDISRKGVFEILSQMKQYKALADEIGKVYMLIEGWHFSLPQACRHVAHITPSVMFGDFLNRLAHATEVGESAETFYKNEQTVVMNDYAIAYENALASVDMMKEMFISMITSIIFMLVFVSILPIISGGDPIELMAIVGFMFIFMEIGFLFFLNTKVPPERLWHTLDIKTDSDVRITRSIQISIMLCSIVAAVIALIYLFVTQLPLLVTVASVSTPLIYIGITVKREEDEVKRREDNFAAFMRALGTSVETRSSTTETILAKLRVHDFGILTKNIDDLYKRLMMRIDRVKAWKHFAAETGSDLIHKFSEIYIEGMRVGANPKEITYIISNNFQKLISLRKMRYQSANVLTGVLYIITAVVVFILYLSVAIIGLMSESFSMSGLGEEARAPQVINTEAINIQGMELILFLIVVTHIVISAVMVAVIGGGKKLTALTHIPVMLWIAAVIGTLAAQSMSGLL